MRFLDFVKNKIAQLKQGVQRYPTPYSYITQKVVQPRVIQPVQKYFQPTQQVRARDIIRELPSAARRVTTAINVPQKVNRFVKQTAFEYPAKNAASLMMQTKPFRQDVLTPTTKVEKFVFGKEPITRAGESWGAQKTGIPAVGVGLTALGTVLDITGAGKGKNVLKGIAKSKNIGEISKLLKTTNIDEKVISKMAKKLVNVSDVNKVKSVIGETEKIFPKVIKPGEVGGVDLMKKVGNGVSDIGQFSKDEKIQLEKLVKEGKLQKYQGDWSTLRPKEFGTMGQAKTIYRPIEPSVSGVVKPKFYPAQEVSIPKGATEGKNLKTGKTFKLETPEAPKTPLKVTETPKQERGLITSAKESELVSPEAKVTLSGNYTPKQNEVLYNSAAKRIAKDEVAAHEFAINTNSDEGTATAIALAQKYRKELNFDKEAYILNEKARRLTEAGREVQAAALIDKLSPEGVVSSAAKLIQKYNETATKKLPEITGTITKEFSDRATQISKLAEGRDRQIAIYQLKRDLNNLIPSSFGDKAITVWKAGLLTSLRTTERNLIGNTLHGAAEVVKDIPSALADRVMALKTGQRTKTFTTQGILSGAKKGAKSAKDIMTLGFDPEASISKYDVKRVNWGQGRIGKALGKYTDFVFNSLGAQDKPFYHSAFARSLYDQAGAAAINASKAGDRAFIEKLVSSPTEDMLKTATQDASIATFKNKNALGKLATNAKRALGNYSAIGEIVAPFTGVPTSIAGQAIAYSPVGLLKGIYNAGKVITSKATAEGIPTLQRQASQEIGRGVIGTGLVGIGVYLANKGLIIGNPKNAQEYAQWQLEGKQPNSILIGGKWRSINSIGPELMVLLAGAQAQHDLKQKNGIGTLAGNIGKTLVSQSSLQGVQQNLNAITNPTQYGQQTIKSTVGSLVPNIISDVGKAFDKTQRETSGYVVEPLKARIPGFRNTLLPSRDVLGNTLPQAPTGVGAFVDLFNSKTPVNNPLVNELSRLNIAGNEATPSKLTANQTIYGQKVKLTPQELDQLESASGGQLQPLLNQIVQEPTYKSLPDEEKKKLIDNAVSDIRTQVKNSLATGEQTFTNSKIGSFNTGNLTDKYKTQMELDTFEKSNKNFQDNGDTVFRKDASGKGIVLSKDKYNSQLYSAQLTSYKKNENLKAWFETADKQLQALDNQLNDPNVDELDKISIQNDIDTLVSNYQKYAGYGGFTKPKKAKKPKKGKVLSVPSVKISALPSAPKVSLKVNKPTVSAKANARAPFRAVVRKPRIATKASFGGKVYKPKMTIRRLYG